MQVTHQAVSQWEKGATLPDIGLLLPLARLFGVRVDDLLNGEPAVGSVGRTADDMPIEEPASKDGAARGDWLGVEPAAHIGGLTQGAMGAELSGGAPGEAARLERVDLEGVKKMLDAAPMTPPSQMEAVVANMAGFDFTLKQIVELAPYVSRDLLDTLLRKANVERVEGELLMELAPFVGRETLGRWVARLDEGSLDMKMVVELAPYVSRESLAALVGRQLERGQEVDWDLVEELAPHLGREVLEVMIGRMPKGALTVEQVVALAPFVGANTLEALLARVDDAAAVDENLEDLAPYLGKEALGRMLARTRERLSTEALLKLAPYLGKEMLESLLRPKQ